jgi:hypothetical protein
VKKVLYFLLLAFPLMVNAYETPEELIESGLSAYKRGDAIAAFKSWTRGSGMEKQDNLEVKAGALERIREFYGEFESYEIVKEHKMTRRARMILLAMNFERGIAFARFQVYRQLSNEWVLNEFKFHTESSLVWPDSSVYGYQ